MLPQLAYHGGALPRLGKQSLWNNVTYLIYWLKLMSPTWQDTKPWRFTFSWYKPNGYLE
jgi:hypothetical protein